ncbi:MAG: patatin-like phospholipase family protein [Acidimicrobiales bacterium]|jgi:NTE family protein
MKIALVLGAGGLVGIAHHVGVLSALSDELGFDQSHVDLAIGTSAGSAIAAYLRTGWSAHDLMKRAGDLQDAAPGTLSGGAIDLLRHGIGSAYVVARATIRVPSFLSLPPVPMLRRAFPAGVVAMDGGANILDRELPRSWPDPRLWLATYDLVSRRRVVLGRPGAPYVPLSSAVRASCAIPGVYAPVRAADGVLVDGGAWSLLNLDLAALGGCDTVVCVAPMSYDPARPPDRRDRVLREVATRALTRAADRLRRQGIRVIMFAPGPLEVLTQGVNLMRSNGLERVADVAYHETVALLRRRGRDGGVGGLAA